MGAEPWAAFPQFPAGVKAYRPPGEGRVQRQRGDSKADAADGVAGASKDAPSDGTPVTSIQPPGVDDWEAAAARPFAFARWATCSHPPHVFAVFSPPALCGHAC
jgi:hypothetical protein